ncbi:hypothetical protein AVEN_114148-1, partial [Araneus ventricosus]
HLNVPDRCLAICGNLHIAVPDFVPGLKRRKLCHFSLSPSSHEKNLIPDEKPRSHVPNPDDLITSLARGEFGVSAATTPSQEEVGLAQTECSKFKNS